MNRFCLRRDLPVGPVWPHPATFSHLCAPLAVFAASYLQASKSENPMKDIKISKIVVNCCVGESGDRLTRAAKVLEELAGGQAPVFSEGTSCSFLSVPPYYRHTISFYSTTTIHSYMPFPL